MVIGYWLVVSTSKVYRGYMNRETFQGGGNRKKTCCGDPPTSIHQPLNPSVPLFQPSPVLPSCSPSLLHLQDQVR